MGAKKSAKGGMAKNSGKKISHEQVQSGGSSHGFKVKRQRRRTVSDDPPFELTGTHLIIILAAVMALAWFVGVLPDP